MRNDLERYYKGQVYILNDGQFICINSVDPLTKMNTSERSRQVRFSKGHPHTKGDEFRGDYTLVIDNGNSAITFDIDKTGSCSIDELRRLEAAYIGTINPEKLTKYNVILANYYDDL